jgi:protein TonB
VISLRQQHWTLAFILALAIHAAAYLYSLDLPGGDPVYRGGGSFDQNDKESPAAAGVFVQLGSSGESSGELPEQAALQEQAPAQKTRESLAQGFVAGADETGSGADEAEPSETPEPVGESIPEQTVSTPTKDIDPAPEKTAEAAAPKTEIATAVPVPKRKPKPPNILPELETLGRRLPVQGPDETARTAEPAKPAPADAPLQDAKTDAGKSAGEEKTINDLAFVNRDGGVGTASGNRTGEVRELNYEDRVMLWLKQNGSYPYEASIWQLEGTVMLKFSINRQGEILNYQLLKQSKWHLLNLAVRKMMRRASPVPPIPPEIEKDEITFIIPVHFDPHLRE